MLIINWLCCHFELVEKSSDDFSISLRYSRNDKKNFVSLRHDYNRQRYSNR